MFWERLKISPVRSQRKFRFGSQMYRPLGEMRIIMPNHDFPCCIYASVLPLDIPPLLSLDTMSELQLDVLPSESCLRHKGSGKEYPMYNDGHLVLTWSSQQIESFYTTMQIRRLHRHFLHPLLSNFMSCYAKLNQIALSKMQKN